MIVELSLGSLGIAFLFLSILTAGRRYKQVLLPYGRLTRQLNLPKHIMAAAGIFLLGLSLLLESGAASAIAAASVVIIAFLLLRLAK